LFLKRVGFTDYRSNAIDVAEAYRTLAAGEKIRKIMAEYRDIILAKFYMMLCRIGFRLRIYKQNPNKTIRYKACIYTPCL